MSDQEHFLSRWSRRKRAAGEAADAAEAQNAGAVESRRECDAPATKPSDLPRRSEPLFDPASLPPLDSISAATDIRAFLAPGVPPELTRAALRRVWTADPAIRDFVGLADYDWDFNTPGSITGFGALEMTDELRRRITQMVGRSLAPEQPEPSPPAERVAGQDTVASPEPAAVPEEPPLGGGKDLGAIQDEAVKSDNESRNFAALPRNEKVYVAAQNDPEKPDSVQSTGNQLHGRALPR